MPLVKPKPTRRVRKGVGSAALTAPAEKPRRPQPPAAVKIRVLSYNILYGCRWTQVRDLLLANPADIICLQEVPQHGHRRPNAVRADQILHDLDRPHSLAMLWYRPPRRVGNMTLVAGSIDKGQILSTSLSQPYGLVNRVVVGGVNLTVVNVHFTEMLGPPPIAFPFSEMLRTREALDLTRRFRGRQEPVLVLGDFNSFWPAPACWVMRTNWTECRRAVGGRHPGTRKTYGLPFVIDHIFVRGPVRVHDYRVIDGGGSDHRAVYAALEVAPPRAAIADPENETNQM